jgi:hypoxanthine phosphoribosyltransferase
MTITSDEVWQTLREADCLHDKQAVNEALSFMAGNIANELSNRNPLVITVMQGGLIFAAELLLRLHFPLTQDYIHATRYTGDTRGGELKWIARPTQSLKDRTVLLVDDIYDEGFTLQAIVEYCKAEGATDVFTAVLVNKVHDRKNGPIPNFMGLDVEDRYVFGFGMDYKGYLRNVPGIYAVKGM